MTLRTFYRRALKRAWDRSFDRARKLSFFVTLGVGFLVWLSTSGWVRTAVSLAWILVAGYFFTALLWQLIRAPHSMYIELLAKLPDPKRKQRCTTLASLLTQCQQVRRDAAYEGVPHH